MYFGVEQYMTISHVAVLFRSSAVVHSMPSTLNTFMWLPCGSGKHCTTTVAAVVVCASYLRVLSSLYHCCIISYTNSACSVSVYPLVLVKLPTCFRSAFEVLPPCVVPQPGLPVPAFARLLMQALVLTTLSPTNFTMASAEIALR